MYVFFLTFWHLPLCPCCPLTLINLKEFPAWLLSTWSHWMIFLAGCPRRDSSCILHCYKSNWCTNNWYLYIQCGSFWGWTIFQQNPSKTCFVIVFKLIFVNSGNNKQLLLWWGYRDVWNNQGRGKCYQPSWRPRLIALIETLII